jgi:hypothetical protein
MRECRSPAPEDPAVEGWTHAEMMNDGSELIVVSLKLHGPARRVRALAIGYGLKMARAILTNRAAIREIT